MAVQKLALEEVDKTSFAILTAKVYKIIVESQDPAHWPTGDDEIRDASALVSYLSKRYQTISKDSLLSFMRDFGIVDKTGPVAVAKPAAPVAVPAPTAPVAQPQASAAPASAPVATPAAATTPPASAPGAVPSTKALPADYVASLGVKLFVDSRNLVRSEDGKYICALCLRDRKADSFHTANAAQGLGGAVRKHENKDRGDADQIIALLPVFQEAPTTSATEVPPAATEPTPAAKGKEDTDGTYSNDLPPGAPTALLEHRVAGAVNPAEDPERVSPEAAAVKAMQQIPGDLKEFIDQRNQELYDAISKRVATAETMIGLVLMVLGSMNDEERAELYERFGKEKRSQVLAVLTREGN